jgi:NTE family protein
MNTVGVALGAGGARGLAHLVVLEAFEELGVTPSVVAGTSIGAVIGAGVAAGLKGEEMRDAVEELRTKKPGRIWNIYENPDYKLALAVMDPTREIGGLLKGEKFLRFIHGWIGVDRFEDLKIPLKLIATDYWRKAEVVLERGDLLESIRASYSMPGLFLPVTMDNTLLVDGGLENPLPYDVIRPHCDISVAIDVSAHLTASESEVPRAYEVLFFAYQIMQNSIVREKLKHSRPDILIRTNIQNVRSLEFNKLRSIYEQALPAKEELKKRLAEMLEKG